ncbi:MAG: protein kinase [Acidobacteria bacterium]|nr:protein kinase [Acidobacteriota bacterium]
MHPVTSEQVRGLATDHRSDIFSFGAILHELLTGKRVFQGETTVDTMQAILRQEAAELPETAPAGVRQIVARCLEKEAARRFQSTRDLAFALQSLASGSGAAPALPPPPPSRRQHLRRAALAAILVAGLAATWMLATRAGRSDPPKVHIVTYRRGLMSGARFANEGKTIIYSASWDGKEPELFSTQEGSPESRPLGIRNAHVPPSPAPERWR